MSDSNGQVTTEQVSQLTQTPGGKLRPDADLLTTKDMRRARKMLRELHGDQAPDPYDLVGSEAFEDRLSIIVWCLRSRTDPGFTWEQAEEIPYGELDLRADRPPPPQGGPPSSPGPASASSEPTGSSKRPRAAATGRNSAPSTA